MTRRKNLTDEIIYKIYKEDLPAKEIAKKYNISISTVSRIKNLVLKKYKEAVEKMENKSKNKTTRKKKTPKISPKHTLKIEEKIKQLNSEILIADLVAILDKYFTPIVIKCIYDNVLTSENFKKLIDNTVEQIKKTGKPEFYVEAVRTLILGLLLQILKEDHIPKILKD